eukprot:883861-Pyramimonas_sp.AAC.1
MVISMAKPQLVLHCLADLRFLIQGFPIQCPHRLISPAVVEPLSGTLGKGRERRQRGRRGRRRKKGRPLEAPSWGSWGPPGSLEGGSKGHLGCAWRPLGGLLGPS